MLSLDYYLSGLLDNLTMCSYAVGHSGLNVIILEMESGGAKFCI